MDSCRKLMRLTVFCSPRPSGKDWQSRCYGFSLSCGLFVILQRSVSINKNSAQLLIL